MSTEGKEEIAAVAQRLSSQLKTNQDANVGFQIMEHAIKSGSLKDPKDFAKALAAYATDAVKKGHATSEKIRDKIIPELIKQVASDPDKGPDQEQLYKKAYHKLRTEQIVKQAAKLKPQDKAKALKDIKTLHQKQAGISDKKLYAMIVKAENKAAKQERAENVAKGKSAKNETAKIKPSKEEKAKIAQETAKDIKALIKTEIALGGDAKQVHKAVKTHLKQTGHKVSDRMVDKIMRQNVNAIQPKTVKGSQVLPDAKGQADKPSIILPKEKTGILTKIGNVKDRLLANSKTTALTSGMAPKIALPQPDKSKKPSWLSGLLEKGKKGLSRAAKVVQSKNSSRSHTQR